MRATNHARKISPSFRDISPATALALRARARLIDVREPGELAADGYIEGAENVPVGRIAEAARGWKTHDELVIVCRSGGRSSAVASALCGMGFERVSNMTGGMLAYKAAGLPVQRR